MSSSLDSLSALEIPLNLLEARCANFLEGVAEDASPEPEDLERSAEEIHNACLPVLATLSFIDPSLSPPASSARTFSPSGSVCEGRHSRSASSVTFDGDYPGSPDVAPRKFSLPSPTLSPLAYSVTSLLQVSEYFQPTSSVKKAHTSRELIVSSTQTVAAIRKVLYNLKGFDPTSSGLKKLAAPPVTASTAREVIEETAVEIVESAVKRAIAAMEAVALAPFALPKARIALCDDEKGCRRLLAEKLLPEFSSGVIHSTESISTLQELLEKSGDEIDLLFLDNILGDGTGWEFIINIRAHPVWSKIFVVIITSDGTFDLPDDSEPTKPKWLARGFDAYVTKPTTKPIIKKTLIDNFQRVRWSTTHEERNWIKI
jgi:CheY-like chemotaxis protein